MDNKTINKMINKFVCERCGKGFKQRGHYKSHINRKFPCEIIDNIVNNINNNNVNLIIANNCNNNELVMNTFTELFEFLQKTDLPIKQWINNQSGQEAGYRQEALLKLLGGLNTIDKLKQFTACSGNFNENTIKKIENYKELFLESNKEINFRGNAGDSSDFTLVGSHNDKHILAISSKLLTSEHSGKLDIEKMSLYAQQYIDKGYNVSFGFCVKNKKETDDMIQRTQSSSKKLAEIYNREDTIVIDHEDLKEAFYKFRDSFKNTQLSELFKSYKKPLVLKMHQKLGVMKTIRLKEEKIEKILWGHIQRSGKSYIIGGSIIEDSLNKDTCNYLVITTAPNETMDQQIEVFNCLQLDDFNIIKLNGDYNKKNKNPTQKDKNIIVCSKQFLQSKIKDSEKTNSIPWLKKIKFNMRFIDESHNGGTTELAKNTLKYYGSGAFTVQITATYSKPSNDYNIPRENWILWDLEDIKLCKNITKEGNIDTLVTKHGLEIKDYIDMYSQESIVNEYSKYPELFLLTDKLTDESTKEIIEYTRDNNYGWSPEACFLLKQSSDKKIDEFQNEEENLNMWYRIFGKKNRFGIPDTDFPDSIVYMERIKKICKNPEINSRYIGDTDDPMIIMAFLPQMDINLISSATKNLLEKKKVIPDYDIICINTKTTGDPKKSIEDARVKAKNTGKKGVLVLSGRQCSLGVSIYNCDIVILLNNNMGFDMIYQMMFRCMTEGENKKAGFVIDLNIHRVISTSIIDYASTIKPSSHPKKSSKYILQERLINLNADDWMPEFGNDPSKITSLSENIYNIYASKTEQALSKLLERIKYKEILLSNEEQVIFNAMFTKGSMNKLQKELVDKLLEDDEETIKDGIEKIKNEKGNSDGEEVEEEDFIDEKVDNVNFMDILKHIIPLICLLTIHDENSTSFTDMFTNIEMNETIYKILLDQVVSWWGKKINKDILKKFVRVYIKYVTGDSETEQIIRTIKELFVKNIDNNKELAIIIGKYLIPQELEKKNNAEVSTPIYLVDRMLDLLPPEFWSNEKTVIDPCVGKGTFTLPIIDRFMKGLADKYPDKDERYKIILEKCLYFCDINPTNIFITKLLIDPYNQYKLNYHLGDSLKIDIKENKEHWRTIENLDLCIGNPPYQLQVGPKKTQPIWNRFHLKFSEDLRENGYLCLVHPSGYRSPTGDFRDVLENMKNYDLKYLNMNDVGEGQRVFKCSTNFDYYLLKKSQYSGYTQIVDINNADHTINISDWDFIPSGGFTELSKLIAKEGDELIDTLHSYSNYETRKPYVSKNKKDDFIHPVVYTISGSKGIQCHYSKSRDHGHFNIPKTIFSNGKSLIHVDRNGDYGMTQFAYAIVDELDNLEKIKKAMETDEFKRIMGFCAINQSHLYHYKIIKLFRKTFYEDFI